MAILRKNKTEKYTVIPNGIFWDENLSLKAIGLLTTLLSLPDNWEFSENGLCEKFKKDGQTSIRTALKELTGAGYLKRTRLRDEKNRITAVEWIISETPCFENHSMENASLENRPQISTKEQNTNKQSTKAATTAPSCEIELFWCEVTGTKSLSKNMKKNFNFYRVQGCTDELILYALKKMDEAGAHSWAYAKKILDDAVANKTFTEEDFVKNKRGHYKGRNIPISREMPSKTTNYLADAMTRKRHLKRRD